MQVVVVVAVSFLFLLSSSIVSFCAADNSMRIDLSEDFENASIDPWYDSSPGKVNWQVERFDAPSESNYSVPPFNVGNYYLRVARNVNLQSGLAILMSPVFTAQPGDVATFSYWIRSRRAQGNTLEVSYLTFEYYNCEIIDRIYCCIGSWTGPKTALKRCWST